MSKHMLLILVVVSLFFTFSNNSLIAAEQASSENKDEKSDSVLDRNNQMMMVFVERLKSGNVAEARKIAKDMAAFSKKYKDTDTIEYKSFYSNIEKEYYLLKNKNSKKKVVWVEEPIADGYYFLAVLDFQEKQYKDAIENIQKCISWNPVRAGYYNERGFIFLNSGADSNIISAQVAYEQALECANSEDDFASGLRGLGFALAARNQFDVSAAAMILSLEFEPNNADANEHLVRLKNFIPGYDFNINVNQARKILKDNKIQTTYSPEHVKVLLKLASEFKIPEEKEKALVFLNRALMLEPQNVEVLNKIKALQK